MNYGSVPNKVGSYRILYNKFTISQRESFQYYFTTITMPQSQIISNTTLLINNLSSNEIQDSLNKKFSSFTLISTIYTSFTRPKRLLASTGLNKNVTTIIQK